MITLERSVWPPSRGVFSPIDFAHYVKQRRFASKRGYAIPSQSELKDYFKFSIVRNPWDRVFSWYRNVIRDPIHRQSFNVAETCSFDEFADRHLDCWALDPQMAWLTDSKGDVAVDYVGTFEKLGETFEHIRTRLDIEEAELPRMLHSKPVNYREHYSGALRQRVATKYAEEIERFRYTFD